MENSLFFYMKIISSIEVVYINITMNGCNIEITNFPIKILIIILKVFFNKYMKMRILTISYILIFFKKYVIQKKINYFLEFQIYTYIDQLVKGLFS